MAAIQSIDNNLIRQFSDKVHVEAQQQVSRLRPYVEVKQIDADDFAYDGLGAVEAKEVFGRVTPVEFSDIEHLRRQLSRRRFAINLPIDSSDLRAMLQDVNGEYARAIARGLMRKADKVIVDAMFADVKTGRNFDTTVTAANDGVITVDATAGFTYEKMLEIKRGFTNNEVGIDMDENIVLGITGDEEEDMFQETELTSGDFSRNYIIDKGKVVEALGMHVVRFGGSVNNPILDVSSGTRDCFAMSSRGICLGISKEMSIQVYPDKRFLETHVVQGVMEIGAVRTEGVLVQKVQTTVVT